MCIFPAPFLKQLSPFSIFQVLGRCTKARFAQTYSLQNYTYFAVTWHLLLAATVDKLAHSDRKVRTLLCFPEVISQGKD